MIFFSTNPYAIDMWLGTLSQNRSEALAKLKTIQQTYLRATGKISLVYQFEHDEKQIDLFFAIHTDTPEQHHADELVLDLEGKYRLARKVYNGALL